MSSMSSPMFGGSVPGMMPMASGMGMHDEILQALAMCQVINDCHEAIQNRISKLERSKGQINKDIQDMRKDAQEWEKDTAKGDVITAELPLIATPQPLILDHNLETKPVLSSSREAESSSLDPPLGLHLVPMKEMNGHRLTWRLEKSKFKECVNRPLVSQHIKIQEKELKLMISLGSDTESDGKSSRDLKAAMEKLVRDGPLTGSVKLKAVADSGGKLLMKFRLFVGSMTQEFIEHDFGERVTFERKFDSDWLKEFADGSLVVGCEILSMT